MQRILFSSDNISFLSVVPGLKLAASCAPGKCRPVKLGHQPHLHAVLFMLPFAAMAISFDLGHV